MAEPATDARVVEVQRQSEQRARHEAQGDEQARDMAHVLNRTVLTIKRRAGIEDRLYGSVTSTDISDAIWKARRIRIDRRKVELDEPIKALGSYRVKMSVWGDIRAVLKVMVVPGGAEEEGGVEAFEAEPSDLEVDY
jgi:large subunit ribosomal protein L9